MPQRPSKKVGPYWQTSDGETVQLYLGDCLTVLRGLPDGCADLVFADPPFNIGYEYGTGYDDNRPREEYLSWTVEWVAECRRLLAPYGSFWAAIGDEYAAELRTILDAAGLYRRGWIVWHYTFGVHLTRQFGRCHTHLLWYSAHPSRYTFDADAVRVPSARQEVYEDARADKRGRVPGDVWTVSRVCGTFNERTSHPCQMPEEVLERIVLSTSRPGDRVADPFLGSGTTAVAALRHGRKVTGVELSEAFLAPAKGRIEAELLSRPATAHLVPSAPSGGSGVRTAFGRGDGGRGRGE